MHTPPATGYRSLVLGCVARMLCLRQRQRCGCCVAPQLHRRPPEEEAPLDMPNMDEADAVIAQLERAAGRIPPPPPPQ